MLMDIGEKRKKEKKERKKERKSIDVVVGHNHHIYILRTGEEKRGEEKRLVV